MIDHATRIVMVGSCFTDEIGGKLRSALFDVSVNPFGTLYNPESMAEEIDCALNLNYFSKSDLFDENGMYRTFRRHSSFSSNDADEMIGRLNADLECTHSDLLNADLLTLTFGSSIIFNHLPSGKVVANCHKQDSRLFERRMMSAAEIAERWIQIIRRLKSVNPDIRIILTISPVRHVGYGLAADRLSKSTLCVACHEIARTFSNGEVIYFPSYEILVDDLRDYRFYKDDLAHPSDMAVEYVYDIFSKSFMTADVIDYAHRWEKLLRGLGHKPRSTESAFKVQLLSKAEALADESPYKDSILQRIKKLTINDISYQ